MGKRSNFKRVEKDFYPTPYEAVVPLFSHLGPWWLEQPELGNPKFAYYEPCAGNLDLIQHLDGHANCFGYSDLKEYDARTHTYDTRADYFITNPPWDREILHPIIMNLSEQRLTWLLIDADWMHTKQAIPYLKRCYKIQSVGRVKWIPDSNMTGKDNVAWYLFYHDRGSNQKIEFYPRV